jgi:lysophospholipase L1-like esterase
VPEGRRLAILSLLAAIPVVLGGWARPTGQANVQGASVTYTALGDSIAVGVGGSRGYVPRFADFLEAQIGAPVQMSNVACSGCTTFDLLNQVRTDPLVREQISRSTVLTWDIGGNDFLLARAAYLQGQCGGPTGEACLQLGVHLFEQNWDAIIAEISALTSGRPVVVLTMDVYDPFERGDEGGSQAVFRPYLEQANAHMIATASAAGFIVAPVHEAFNGSAGDEDPNMKGYIADDAIHPTDAGHQRIADLLAEAGRDALGRLRMQLAS